MVVEVFFNIEIFLILVGLILERFLVWLGILLIIIRVEVLLKVLVFWILIVGLLVLGIVFWVLIYKFGIFLVNVVFKFGEEDFLSFLLFIVVIEFVKVVFFCVL